MNAKQNNKAFWFVLIGLFLFVQLGWAGTTGKIAGKVIDKETGDPLIGCNVIIIGTSMGAMVGPDGNYFVLGVPPGDYEVKASMLGYGAITQTKVNVRSDYTTPLDFELSETVLEGEEITIVAKKPLVVRDNTSSNRTVSGADIKNMPVDNYNDAIAASAGTQGEGRNLHVRGGRAGEILYLVDGMPIRDALVGGSHGMEVSNNAIAELSMLSGGFNAEYGDAQSGVINIVTKDADPKWSGNLMYRTDDFGFSSLNDYSWNSDYVEFSLGGKEPLTGYLLESLGIDFPGQPITFFFSMTADATDGSLYLGRDRTLYEGPLFNYSSREHETLTSSVKVAWRLDDSKKLTFSFRNSTEDNEAYEYAYIYTPTTGDISKRKGSQWALTWNHTLSPKTFYTFNASRFESSLEWLPGGRTPDDFPRGWEIEPYEYPEDITNIDMNEPFQDGDIILLNDGRGGEPFEDIDGNGVRTAAEPFEPFIDLSGDGKYNDANYYLNASGQPIFSMPYRDWWEPYLDRNGNGVYDPPNGVWNIAEAYVDANGNGRWDFGEDFTDLNENEICDPEQEEFIDLNGNGVRDLEDDFWDPAQHAEPYKDLNGNGQFDEGEPYYDRNNNNKWDTEFPGAFDRWAFWQDRKSVTWTFKGDMTSQVTNQQQIKSGFEYKYYEQSMQEIQYPDNLYTGVPDGGPYPDRGVFRDNYVRYPSSGALYLQDKMEFQGMVVNAGLRYDFYWAGKQVEYEPFIDENGDGVWNGNESFTDLDLNQEWNKLANQWKTSLSPRLGISYPITENDVLYFSYGHFSQMPELQFVYQRATQGGSAIRTYGNPSLKPQKTVAYEFGVDHAFNDNMSIDVTGFFKDIHDLINQELFRPTGQREFYMYVNSDYGSVRGFEVELTKRYSHHISGKFSYTFSIAKGKNSSESAGYFDSISGIPLPVKENYLDWDERHSISLNADIRFLEDDHLNLFGLSLPDKWGLNVLWQYGSGLPYTYMPPQVRSEERPQRVNEYRMPWTSTVDMKLDKDFELVSMDYKVFLEVKNLFDKENVEFVEEETGTWYGRGERLIDFDPTHLGAGRNVRFGLEIMW